MSETPKLTPEERAEAEILYERLSGDGDALERFIYFAVSIRAQLERELAKLRQMVAQQAEDEGLWFNAATAPEAYLQQELRKLHAAVEETK